MKFKTTQKAMKESYTNIVKVGYCNIQFLLHYEQPIAYTAGCNGWKSDIYIIDRKTILSTGYAPFGNIEIPYDTLRKYDVKAERIVHDYSLQPEQRKEQVTKLLEKFIESEVKTWKNYSNF